MEFMRGKKRLQYIRAIDKNHCTAKHLPSNTHSHIKFTRALIRTMFSFDRNGRVEIVVGVGGQQACDIIELYSIAGATFWEIGKYESFAQAHTHTHDRVAVTAMNKKKIYDKTINYPIYTRCIQLYYRRPTTIFASTKRTRAKNSINNTSSASKISTNEYSEKEQEREIGQHSQHTHAKKKEFLSHVGIYL